MGKPGMIEDWELIAPPKEKFSKSFQEYLNTRLTLDEMMKMKKEVPETDHESSSLIDLATTKLDGRMFYSEEDGRWHKR